MNTILKKVNRFDQASDIVYTVEKIAQLKNAGFSKEEIAFAEKRNKENKTTLFHFNKFSHQIFVQLITVDKKEKNQSLEKNRKAGNSLVASINKEKLSSIVVADLSDTKAELLAFCEGMLLGNYQFLKYYSDKEKKQNKLKTISLVSVNISEKEVNELNSVSEFTLFCRDLVNEPVSYLTSAQLSKEIQKLGKNAGFKTEVFNKAKIESLKMGGLLAVNKGSVQPPTFTVLEWKPSKNKNKKPLILVGKGVVYDTGGLSLKPTAGSMDEMKSDMAGAAAVACAIAALAQNKVPYHVIGLIPSTDNRPGGDAYAPGDVITMHNGITVEVLNTDAEGRMILGDALSYAQKYNPELVIDLATLTGAAVRAVGLIATCSMGTADEKVHQKLKDSGFAVNERVVEVPFWDEYAEMIKSSVADIKNIGGANAGHITAGKFLEVFTKNKKGDKAYPWIHLDIAGPSFLPSDDSYRKCGGSGVGVRLLYDFVKNLAHE